MDNNQKHISVIGGSLLVIGALTLASVTVSTAITSSTDLAAAVPLFTRPPAAQVRPMMDAQVGGTMVQQARVEAAKDGVIVPAHMIADLCRAAKFDQAADTRAEVKETMMQTGAKAPYPAPKPLPPKPLNTTNTAPVQ